MTARQANALIATLAALAIILGAAVWLTQPPKQYQQMRPLPLTSSPGYWVYADLTANPALVACPPSGPGSMVVILERRGDFGYLERADGCRGWAPLFTLTDPETGELLY